MSEEFGGFDCVSIDERSGRGIFQLPLCGLLDEGAGPAFSLELSCHLEAPELTIFTPGQWYFQWYGVGSRHNALQLTNLPLANGQIVDCKVGMEGMTRGADYLIDATAFNQARVENVKKENSSKDDTSEKFISVILKNGNALIFELVNVDHKGQGNALLSKMIHPSGRALEFTWTGQTTSPRLTRISDDQGELFKASWTDAALVGMEVFPGTQEQVSYEITREKDSTVLSVFGADVLAKKLKYKLTVMDGAVNKLERVRVYASADTNDAELTDVASFTYKDEQVASYSIVLQGQNVADGFVATYTYTQDSSAHTSMTSVRCTQGTVKKDGMQMSKELGVYEYTFKDDWLIATTFSVDGVVTTTEHAFSVSKETRHTQLKSTRRVDGIVVDEGSWRFDVLGNLVSRTEGDVITEWTYFNDYDVYDVKEYSERVSEIDASNWLGKWHLAALDYANPVGWGLLGFANKGLTWYSVLHTTVTLSHTGTDYAKKAFELPIDANYPGSTAGFSSHIESELVSRKIGPDLHALSLTYYGYAKFSPLAHSGIARKHVLVPAMKLVVLEPSYETVDISDTQLKIATQWSNAYASSLSQQLTSAEEGEDKEHFERAIKNLNDCLAAQSKLNATGFRLKKPWAADSMRVSELTYEADPKNAGFGRTKTNTSYALDGEGRKMADTAVVSQFDYQRDAKSPRLLKTSTQVKTADGISVQSSATRSELTGRLYETLDGQGIRSVFSYDDKGSLTQRKVVQADTVLTTIEFKVTPLGGGKHQFERRDTDLGSATRVVEDAYGHVCESWDSDDGNTWQQWVDASFDDLGRLSTFTEFDYDGGNQEISRHVTTYQYGDDEVTATFALVDSKGATLQSKTAKMTHAADHTRVVRGQFQQDHSVERATRTVTTRSGPVGDSSQGMEVQVAYDPAGRFASGRTRTFSGGKETVLDTATVTYDALGLPDKITRQSGGVSSISTYDYDRYGRLIKQNDNGIVIRNSYPATTLAGIATESTVQGSGKDSKAVSLGSQIVDGLGRVQSRKVSGLETKFSYEHGSSRPRPPAVEGPPLLKGYSVAWDPETLSYTESCPVRDTLAGDGNQALSTQTCVSRKGSLLSVTDIAGYVTQYQYDVFGRLSSSSSQACRSSFTYGDDGSLTQEVIEDLFDKRSMKVTYAYDPTGSEISRTFAADGMATHTLVRELTPEGRLAKCTLKVGAKDHSSDQYSYDNGGRLTAWSASGKCISLSSSTSTDLIEQTFEYDELGNVVQTQPKGKPGWDGYQWGPVIEREFDAAKPGLLTKHESQITSDEQGRWTSGGLSYYPDGKLKQANGSNGSTQLLFGYDDLGRLRGMFQEGGNYSPRGFQFHYRVGKIYARSQMTTNAKVWSGVLRRDLLLLNDSPACYLQEMRDDGNRVASSFELRDAAGTIFATVKNKSDISYHIYPPYGIGGFGEASPNWLGFKGEPILANNTYYLGSRRVYDPSRLSFQSPDPTSPFGGGGPAAYAYCGGDPVNFHDPSGLQQVAHYSRKASGTLLETKEFRIGLAAVGLLAAPFTGGTSLGLAVAATGLAVVATSFEIASIVLEDSDPDLAQTLGYVGMGVGVGGMALEFGIAASARRGAGLSMRSAAAGPGYARGGGESSRLSTFGQKSKQVTIIPAQKGRTLWPDWYEESVPGALPRRFWGPDMAISQTHVNEPLIRISRRGSASDIHIYSGVHGQSNGDNWTTYRSRGGKVSVRRMPLLNDARFLNEDKWGFSQASRAQQLKKIVAEDSVARFNRILRTNDDYRAVRTNLRGRKIFVHDIRSILAADLTALESLPGHHIAAFCYARNDERWLSRYGFAPVPSYLG
jgi:RHS repeat-associated protein